MYPVQGLTGVVPDMGRTIASKINSIALGSTSLRQCGVSHLAALGTGTGTAQVSCWSTTHPTATGNKGGEGDLGGKREVESLRNPLPLHCFRWLGLTESWG